MKTITASRRSVWTVMIVFIVTIAATISDLGVLAQMGSARSQDRLSRGIELFRAGRHDEALAELRAVVKVRPHTALAYYYAAHIRYGKGQYPQARKNLLAALEDSTDFHDAAGMLACTDLKIGNVTDALIEWRRFTAAVGVLNPGEPVTERSIMLPAEYRDRLARARVAAGIDSAASRSLSSSASAVGRMDTARSSDAALRDLDRRIESRIRMGYYSMGGAALLLVLGTVFTIIWMRRRRRLKPELTFDTEMNRMAAALPETEEFTLGEEEPAEQPGPVVPPPGPYSLGPDHEPPSYLRENPYEYPAREHYEQAPQREHNAYLGPREETTLSRPAAEPEDTRRPITEEVKTLVTRMHRERHSIVDIARIADLTRTEVELIVAVRTRRVEQLVETVAREEGDTLDADALHKAVSELHSEGNGVQEIARRLGISSSEVRLAFAVLDNRAGRNVV